MAGLSFLPSANQSPEDQSSANALSPGQSAIQTLSLNLPRILGATQPGTPGAGFNSNGIVGSTHGDPNQIVLQALMSSAMSQPGQGSDEELRRRLASLFGGTPTLNMPPQRPTITPGDTGGGGSTVPPTTPTQPNPNPNPMPPTPPVPPVGTSFDRAGFGLKA